MKKTKYRIIPFTTFVGNQYLQFQRGLKWYFVPREAEARVLGNFLTQKECPNELQPMSMNCAKFMHVSLRHKEKELTNFMVKYPDIEEYFKKLRDEREKYLNKHKPQL